MGDALRLGDGELAMGGITHVMGVINMSPESKNTFTVANSVDEALLMAGRYRDWGASLVDVGGQSSNYENPGVGAHEEITRVAPVIEALVAEGHLVAVDTWRPEVAEAALSAGASMVNDTSGMNDAEMRRLVADAGAAAILVYLEGPDPRNVDQVEIAADKARVTADRLRPRVEELASAGISDIVIDPGIAISYRGDYDAYTRMQLEVVTGLQALKDLGHPVMIPIPRKRDGHRVAAYVSLAMEHGADLVRAHDVAMACDLARLFGREARLR